MVTILLEQIIELLKGFIDSFKDHAAEVAEKLGLISEDTSDINDNTDTIISLDSAIKDNTDILVANTGAIKNSSQATSVNTAAIASDTTVIRNNINTISVNSGKTAAFTEDVATNTLNILDKVTTIASDTTQMRSDNQVIIANTNDLETYLHYATKGLKKVNYGTGDLITFTTDLQDDLIDSIVHIDANNTGYEKVQLTRCGKNLLDTSHFVYGSPANVVGYPDSIGPSDRAIIFDRIPSDQPLILSCHNYEEARNLLNGFRVIQCVDGIVVWQSGAIAIPYDSVGTLEIPVVPNSYIIVNVWARSGYAPIQIPINGWVQVERGSVNTEYEPFIGDHYVIDLGETLTQGGDLNLDRGTLIRTDGTFKQVAGTEIHSFEGLNNIYSNVIKVTTSGTTTEYNVHTDKCSIGYNESIYNIIEREV